MRLGTPVAASVAEDDMRCARNSTEKYDRVSNKVPSRGFEEEKEGEERGTTEGEGAFGSAGEGAVEEEVEVDVSCVLLDAGNL